MLTPTVIAIYNLAFPVLPFIVHSFTLALIFTHLSPFSTPRPPLPSPRLFDFVALAQWTLLPLSLPPHLILISLCFIALTTSLLFLLLAAGVFSVYFAYAACFPPTDCSLKPKRALNQWQFTLPPSGFFLFFILLPPSLFQQHCY